MSKRSQQIERIAKYLDDGLNAALHGGPQTGKSWVTDGVLATLARDSVTTIRIDLSLYGSGADVFVAIAAEVGAKQGGPTGIHDVWRSLRAALQPRSRPIGLVLDEFDAVVRFPDSQDFLRLLRELLHRPQITMCAGLIVSRRTLEAIESEVRGISTLATICVSEYARAIEMADLRSVWSETTEVDDSDLEECLTWSAGHPPLVRYWLSARPDRNPTDHCEHTQVIEFRRLVEHLSKAKLDDAAAQLVLGPVVDDWFIQVRHLEMLGVVGIGGEPTRLGSHSVFRECLRQGTLSMNPWGVLGAVEIALRGLIEERLSGQWGDEWVETLKNRHRGVTRMVEEAAPKQAIDRRRFGREGPWLAYTYPQDLADIIIRLWEEFAPVFAFEGDKRSWKHRLDTIAMYRTPVAHNRAYVLGPNERMQCRLFAEQILRAIEEFRQTSTSDDA